MTFRIKSAKREKERGRVLRSKSAYFQRQNRGFKKKGRKARLIDDANSYRPQGAKKKLNSKERFVARSPELQSKLCAEYLFESSPRCSRLLFLSYKALA